MTISEKFDIDEDELHSKSFENDFWSNSSEFYEQVKDKDETDLTEKQLDWLEKIESGLEE